MVTKLYVKLKKSGSRLCLPSKQAVLLDLELTDLNISVCQDEEQNFDVFACYVVFSFKRHP